MTNSNSSGGSQGCLTHGWLWLLLLLCPLKACRWPKSFLPTPRHTSLPQGWDLYQDAGWTLAQPWWVWHSDSPMPFPLTLLGSWGFQCCRQMTPGQDVRAAGIVVLHELPPLGSWDSWWHATRDGDGWADTVLRCLSPRKPALPASDAPRSRGDRQEWKSHQENLFKAIPRYHAAKAKCEHASALPMTLLTAGRCLREMYSTNHTAAPLQSPTLPLPPLFPFRTRRARGLERRGTLPGSLCLERIPRG